MLTRAKLSSFHIQSKINFMKAKPIVKFYKRWLQLVLEGEISLTYIEICLR